MKYQRLKPGDRIMLGDEYWHLSWKTWIKSMMAGCFVTENGAKYRRPIKPKKKGSK